jgi:hypothetical protein
MAGSLIASMGSIAVGFGTMLAAPSKALYAVAVNYRKPSDGETSSVKSGGSSSRKSNDSVEKFDPQPIRKSALQAYGGIAMQKTQSDQSGSTIASHVNRATTIDYQLKKDLGPKGLGRILKAAAEGMY